MTTALPPPKPPASWFVLVVRLPLEGASYELGRGLILRRPTKKLTIFDLAAAGSVGFSEWAVLERLTDGVTGEVESVTDEARTPGYDALNRVWLVSAMLALRGFQRFVFPAVSAYSWDTIAGHVGNDESRGQAPFTKAALPKFRGDLLEYHLKVMVLDPKEKVTPFDAAEAQWIRENVETFERLVTSDTKFKFALEAAVDSRFARDGRAAIARVWSGIEGLFDVMSELNFRLGLHVASLLEPRGKSRVECFKQMKKLYKVRSEAVHGAAMKNAQMVEGLQSSWDLLRRLLLVAVQRGSMWTAEEMIESLLT